MTEKQKRALNEVTRAFRKIDMIYLRKLTPEIKEELLNPRSNWIDRNGDKFLEHRVIFMDDDIVIAVWRNNNWTEIYAYLS